MRAALRQRWARVVPAEIPVLAYLAVAAAVTAAIEVVAWRDGDQIAIVAAGLLGVIAVAFAVGARLRARGRPAAAALLGSLVLLLAIPAFGVLYADGRVLILVAPIAFVLAVPYVRGLALVAMALLAVLAALATALLPVLPITEARYAASPYDTTGMIFGTVAASGVLVLLTLRLHRSSETQSARYSSLVEDLSVGIVRLAPGGRLLEANDALVQLLRYPSRAQLLATSGREIYGALDAELESRLRRDAGGQIKGEVRVRRFDGTDAWVRIHLRTTRDAGGTARWHEGTVEDVTSERAQLEAQNRLAAVLESAPDGVYGLALDGTVESFNAEAERIYGAAEADTVGRSVFDLVPEGQRERFAGLLERVAMGEHVGPFDTDQPLLDGTTLIVSLTASPIHDADGRVASAAIVARDVTEHRRLQRDRERLESQLRQAQKMEAIGRLAGGIAHDFNNLLTAIQGFGGIVAAGLDGPLLEDQRQVIRAAERAAELTRRLLTFSHHAPASPRPVAIDDALEDSLRMTRRLVPERIELEVDLRSNCHVLADPVELEQVLLNLAINAVDAIPGAGRIRIETRLEAMGPAFADGYLGTPTGPHVRLAVSDTGRGMDEATRARIFEPFFTTKERGEGTGLGLATVYAIVRRAGGTAWAESSPGAGSTFILYFPVVAPHADLAQPLAGADPIGTGRILLVEDEPAVRLLAARILERAGYTVHAAASPGEALDMTHGSPYDALVSDVVMPGMSGAELADLLPAGLPAVFMSGYTGRDGPDLHLDRPTRILVAKPFEAAALTRAVRAVLDAAGEPGQPDHDPPPVT